jgi:NADH-quinone oxidoreductase subunit G
VDHELSANIIDLCPVGALNNKPYRYRARAWEMTQHPLVSPHDSVGANLYAHVLRGRIMRIVPRPNEEVNETWIADRDRFSYQGIYSEDRLMKPLVRENGMWQESDWESALSLAAERLGKVAKNQGGAQIGAIASPSSTLEELYLLAKLTRGLGSSNLDHRLRRSDFRDEATEPLFPGLGCSIADIERADSVLVIGSNLRAEVPLIAHRVRKAAVRGARISFVNPVQYPYLFPVAGYLASNGLEMFDHLVAIAAAHIRSAGGSAPESIAALVANVQPSEAHASVAQQLTSGERRHVLLGAIAQRDPAFADLRVVAEALANMTGATLGYLSDGGNAVGAHLAGVLPHRASAGRSVQTPGMNLADMFAARLRAYVILGAIEPSLDIAAPGAFEALKAAECVIALTPYGSAREFADIILPIGTFAETSGTYVNMEGRWQSVPGAARPLGEARPGWKVLRVLANLLNLSGFEYTSSEHITEELHKEIEHAPEFRLKSSARTLQSKLALNAAGTQRDVPIYQVDAIVRRAMSLQETPAGTEGRRGQSA